MAENDKLVSILAYFLVGIIWYFVDKKAQNNITKFHVKQSLNLLIISIVISVVLSIISTIIAVITLGFGLIILGPLIMLVNVAILVLWIIGLINAINLKSNQIPVIGVFAEKYLTF